MERPEDLALLVDRGDGTAVEGMDEAVEKWFPLRRTNTPQADHEGSPPAHGYAEFIAVLRGDVVAMRVAIGPYGAIQNAYGIDELPPAAPVSAEALRAYTAFPVLSGGRR